MDTQANIEFFVDNMELFDSREDALAVNESEGLQCDAMPVGGSWLLVCPQERFEGLHLVFGQVLSTYLPATYIDGLINGPETC